MLHGTTITLYNKAQTGTDPFNNPVYDWYAESYVIDNVLIGEPTPEERLNELNLSGKMIAYTLGIPKGDTHEWEDQIVEFFGRRFRTFGITVEGIESNIPLFWHHKVKCERYE